MENSVDFIENSVLPFGRFENLLGDPGVGRHAVFLREATL